MIQLPLPVPTSLERSYVNGLNAAEEAYTQALKDDASLASVKKQIELQAAIKSAAYALLACLS